MTRDKSLIDISATLALENEKRAPHRDEHVCPCKPADFPARSR